jgi:hypothetical protein
MDSKLVTTALLGRTATSKAPFQNYNGEDLVVNQDLLGVARQQKPTAGPFESTTTKIEIKLHKLGPKHPIKK